MRSPQRVRVIRKKRNWGLGCGWLVVIPLLMLVLCQLYQGTLTPADPHPLLLPDLHVHLPLTNSSRPVLVGGQQSAARRMLDLESQVMENYLRVHLALALSSGNLGRRLRSPPLADVGTLRDLHTFQPLLTPREKAHLLYLFEVFSSVCGNNSLSFFLLDSSLVGSLRHHGVIPWSDVSISVGMRVEDQWMLREVLDGLQGVMLMWPNPYSWSLRLQDVRPDPPHLVRMTFIHIQFYRHNATHVWADTWGDRRLFTAPHHRVFPLVLRPFEGYWVPTPCDSMAVLTPHAVQCHAVLEDQEELQFRDGGVVSCKVLAHVFPFVSRRVTMTSHSLLEQVTVNGTLLDTLLVGGCVLDTLSPFTVS